MICRDVLPILSEYIDGELQADLVASVESHLEECSSCRQELAALKQLTQTLSSTAEIEPPDFLLAQIEAATVNRQTISRRVRRVFNRIPQTPRRVGLTSAMAVVGVLAAVLLTHSVARHPAHVANVATRPSPHSVMLAKQPTAAVEPQTTITKTVLPETSAGISTTARPVVAVNKHAHHNRTLLAKRAVHPAARMVALKPGQESADPVQVDRLAQPSDESDVPSNVPADAVVDSEKTSAPAEQSDNKIVTVASASNVSHTVKLDDPADLQRLRDRLRRKYREAEMGQSMSVESVPIGIASIRF